MTAPRALIGDRLVLVGPTLSARARVATDPAVGDAEQAAARLDVLRAVRAAHLQAGGVATAAAELLGVSRARWYELRTVAGVPASDAPRRGARGAGVGES